eukprot:TRINITY_DN1776_c0_g1_i2.p1 TRINITY_DN1776_c0_g1~~TRINITY_DN1776_c0_g1_i2.p1  ORF type:complete len:178 (-),score=18.18 TRINITY_DN1776_c0_g1_i2:53-586(-)
MNILRKIAHISKKEEPKEVAEDIQDPNLFSGTFRINPIIGNLLAKSENNQGKGLLDGIPEPELLAIFTRLPIEDLLSLSRTCVRIFSIIFGPSLGLTMFWQNELNKSLVNGKVMSREDYLVLHKTQSVPHDTYATSLHDPEWGGKGATNVAEASPRMAKMQELIKGSFRVPLDRSEW